MRVLGTTLRNNRRRQLAQQQAAAGGGDACSAGQQQQAQQQARQARQALQRAAAQQRHAAQIAELTRQHPLSLTPAQAKYRAEFRDTRVVCLSTEIEQGNVEYKYRLTGCGHSEHRRHQLVRVCVCGAGRGLSVTRCCA
jgi:uncharacterized protein involved in type VI secretion and phage assembly